MGGIQCIITHHSYSICITYKLSTLNSLCCQKGREPVASEAEAQMLRHDRDSPPSVSRLRLRTHLFILQSLAIVTDV